MERTRNARGSGELLRGEIVDAAIALIDATNDTAALTLRGIARQAQISAPSIYGHFEDLDEVVEAVLAKSFSQLTDDLLAAQAQHRAPARALVAGCQAYLEFGWSHRARYRLMFAAAGYAEDAVAAYDVIEDCIRSCVAAGSSTSADPHADTFLLWVAMHGLATLDKPARGDYRRLGRIDRPAMLNALVQRLARLEQS